MPLLEYVNKLDYVSVIAGAPMEVIQCKTNDILSEVVLERIISASETKVEGPIGEYYGSICPAKGAPQPVIMANAITYQSNSIVPITVAGRSRDETHAVWAFSICAGNPRLIAASRPTNCQGLVPIRVSGYQVDRKTLRKRRPGPGHFAAKLGKLFSPLTLVDLYQRPSILVTCVKSSELKRPGAGHSQRRLPVGDYSTYDLVPYATHDIELRKPQAKVVSLCMLPTEFKTLDLPRVEAFFFNASYPEDLQRQVLDNWPAYGFEGIPVNP
ncbi:Carboxylyase-like protein [Penicillium chermesinum]|nr:Carboxylyase-like protein [Penicillium chermesinum]